MKISKVIFVAAALLAVTAMQAQIRFGVKGALDFTKVKFDKEFTKSDNITAFHIGPTLETLFGPVGVEASVLFAQKGFNLDDETMKTSYLEVPVNLKYKFGMTGISPYLAAGPYARFRVAGDKVWDIKDSKIGDQVKSKGFAAGLNFGAGIELATFIQVGVNFDWALTDDFNAFREQSTKDKFSGKSHAWSVVAAVFF